MDKPRPKTSSIPTKVEKPKVAIIGSGICGASSAYYLSQAFSNLEITVFEKNSHVGGRMADVLYRDSHAELGAGIFIEANRNIVELAKKFGCPSVVHDRNRRTICWDGQNVLYKSNVWFGKIRLMYNYGWSFFRLHRYLSYMLAEFMKCYDNVDLKKTDKPAFEGPQDFLKVARLEELLNKTGLEYVREIGMKENFIRDFLYGVVSGIYNNRIETINAVAIAVALQGVFQKSFRFKEGNNSLVRKMLIDKNDFCTVKLDTEVREVVYNQKTKNYTLKHHLRGSTKTEQSDFAVVIVATPFKQSNIKFTGVQLKQNMDLVQNNKKVITTIVEGKIRNEFFGLSPNEPRVESIYLAEGADRKLPSVKSLDATENFKDGTSLYRIESGEPMSQKKLNEVFESPKVITAHTWEFAYPSLPTLKPEKLIKFRLNEGLYFPNAMEFTASCMEMESISARNVVKLIADKEGAKWERRE
jgi:prenylcysteine oxidase/farnesylcysteine lyase